MLDHWAKKAAAKVLQKETREQSQHSRRESHHPRLLSRADITHSDDVRTQEPSAQMKLLLL